MKLHVIYEMAENGRIWSYFADLDGIVGNGSTVDEARASLLESFRLAREVGQELRYGNVLAVETYTVPV